MGPPAGWTPGGPPPSLSSWRRPGVQGHAYSAHVTADELVSVALRIVREAPYGFVVTAEPEGAPSGRVVQHLEVSDELAVSFSTSPKSRKAARVAASGMATYLVENRDRFAYVSLSGPARLSDDLEERRRLWDEGLRAFFPDGPDGPDFILVELTAQRIELWSFADEVHPDPYGLVPATLVRDGGGWHVVESGHREVDRDGFD